MDKKTLSAHIRRNELAAFFKAAAQLNTAVEAWQNELVLLERRFVELEDQESDGVLSPEEASRLRNGISRDGMKLLDELDAFQPLHPAFPNVRKLKNRLCGYRWALACWRLCWFGNLHHSGTTGHWHKIPPS